MYDGHRCWMCGWIISKDNKKLGLKTHIRHSRHKWNRKKAHLTAKTAVTKDKHEDEQENLSQASLLGGRQSCRQQMAVQVPRLHPTG